MTAKRAAKTRPAAPATSASLIGDLIALGPARLAQYIAVNDEASFVARELLACVAAAATAFGSKSPELQKLGSIVGTPQKVGADRAMHRLRVYGITEAEVLATLGPPPDELLWKVSALPQIEALLMKYREALLIAQAIPRAEDGAQEVVAIEANIARLEEKAASLSRLAQAIKLGPRWPVPPPAFWTKPQDEVRRWPKSAHAKLERWEQVGDRIVNLYDLIASRVPAQRRQRLQSGPARVVYNQTALKLTALTVTDVWVSRFGLSPLSRALTAQDVKNRLQKRLASVSRPQVFPPPRNTVH
jgi:hypothetical protein